MASSVKLTDADFADSQVALSDADFQDTPSQAQDPLKTYKTENVGDAFNNIFVRPGAGVRNVLRGGNYMQGFDDPNSVQTFQGQALDNFYRSGFMSEHPMLKEALGVGVSAGGLAADIATNPADVLGMLIGKAPIKGTGTTLGGEIAGSEIGKTVGRMVNAPLGAQTVNPRLTRTPGAIERLQSMQASRKGRAEVSKLLPDLKLSPDIKQNKPTGALSEGFNLIKKTNNPVEVADKFRIEKEGLIRQVDQLVTENNKPVDPNFLRGRVSTLLAKYKKNMSPKELKKMQMAVDEEAQWIDNQNGFDTVKANERKRYLYQETKRIQEKQSQGISTIDAPERNIVKDAFARAYKESIEGSHPDIQKLNSRFDGLEKGLDASAKMAERAMEQGSPLERIMSQTIGRPNVPGVAAAAVREIPQMLKGLGRTTGKIESLSKKSAELLNQSRMKQAESLLASFMNKQKMNMSNAEYFRKVITPDDVQSVMRKVPSESRKLLE